MWSGLNISGLDSSGSAFDSSLQLHFSKRISILSYPAGFVPFFTHTIRSRLPGSSHGRKLTYQRDSGRDELYLIYNQFLKPSLANKAPVM